MYITKELECRKCNKILLYQYRESVKGRWQFFAYCKHCNSTNWYPLERKTESNKRDNTDKNLIKKFGKDYCEICLVPKDVYPNHFEMHHIIEVQNGGESTADNLLCVCISCHKLIHHQRTYLAHYYNKLSTKPC